MKSCTDALNNQLSISGERRSGVKDVLASFEKTIKENNEAGVTSSMYLNNLLTKGDKNTRTSRGYCGNSSFTSTTVSCSSDWASNSSVHSGYTVTDRTCDDNDDSSISCDSFGEGDEDDCEVPSIADDINNNRSKRTNNSHPANGRTSLSPRRRSGPVASTLRRHPNGVPETIFEANGDSRHSRKSRSSQKSSRSRRSCDSDDSDADSFC